MGSSLHESSKFVDLSGFDPRIEKRWAANPFPSTEVPLRTINRATKIYRTLPIALLCPNGHLYRRSLSVPLPTLPKLGCTECEGVKVCPGVNDLESQRPDLVEIWDNEKNTKLPSEISIYSNERVYWHNRTCDHKYETKLGNQTDKKNLPVSCPICTFRILQSGVNDLKTLRPDLMVLWANENVLDPSQLSPQGRSKALWYCPKGLSHLTSVEIGYMVRTQGRSCRVCDGKELCIGFNDAATRLAHCVEEWDVDANGGITLKDFQMTGKHAKSYWWWRCRDNADHTWEAMPIQRISGYGKCPHCYKSRSSLEVEVFECVRGIWPEAKRNNRSVLGSRLELDIWLPSQRVGIEVNGEFWHSETLNSEVRASHDRKELRAQSKGVTLLVVWEEEWLSDQAKVQADLIEMVKTGSVKPEYTYEWRRRNPSQREIKELKATTIEIK